MDSPESVSLARRTVNGLVESMSLIWRTVNGLAESMSLAWRTVNGLIESMSLVWRTMNGLVEFMSLAWRTVNGLPDSRFHALAGDLGWQPFGLSESCHQQTAEVRAVVISAKQKGGQWPPFRIQRMLNPRTLHPGTAAVSSTGSGGAACGALSTRSGGCVRG